MKFLSYVFMFMLPSLTFAEDISLCKSGWSETQTGNHGKAIELFKQCIKSGNLTKSSLARTYRNIGIASKRNGQFKEAIDSYNRALLESPTDSWDDYVNRGNAWSELGEYEKALNDYNKALEIKPHYNEAYYNRGIVFEKQEKKGEAVEEFKKAYEYGLRSQLLYERFVAHGLVEE